MSSQAFSTRIKTGINTLLQPLGLELGTTLKRRIEETRIRAMESRGHWKNARYNQGFKLDAEKWLEFLKQTCAPFAAMYNLLSPSMNGDPHEYYLQNGWFESVDAEVLYSIIRYLKPRRIFEVGSGFSTRLMRKAIKDGDLTTKITSVDPHPHSNTNIEPYADEYIKSQIESIEVEKIINRLNAGDILFIDSSHKVMTGGDIPYLFLEVIPRLKPGVYIHVHDIFLPLDYPKSWVEWGWTEQYLVHAFLCYNEAFEITWLAKYMWEYHKSDVLEAIPNALPNATPSSLWLKKLC
jgi:hypothetical protein